MHMVVVVAADQRLPEQLHPVRTPGGRHHALMTWESELPSQLAGEHIKRLARAHRVAEVVGITRSACPPSGRRLRLRRCSACPAYPRSHRIRGSGQDEGRASQNMTATARKSERFRAAVSNSSRPVISTGLSTTPSAGRVSSDELPQLASNTAASSTAAIDRVIAPRLVCAAGCR